MFILCFLRFLLCSGFHVTAAYMNFGSSNPQLSGKGYHLLQQASTVSILLRDSDAPDDVDWTKRPFVDLEVTKQDYV